MLEVELVASYPAIAHILCDDTAEALYECNNRSSVYNILIRNERNISIALHNKWRSDPDDEVARIKDFIHGLPERLDKKGTKLWRKVRNYIPNCMNKELDYGSHTLYADTVARSIDELFFTASQRVPRMETPLVHAHEHGDSHVHLGGAVSWNVQWHLIMTRQYPLWAYSKAPTRLLKEGQFYKLLEKVVKIRKSLIQKFSLEEWSEHPSFETVLYRKLRFLGEECLDDIDVRDYVLIRSIARREMLIGEVENLNEFTGPAWKRFYGQRIGKLIPGNRYWDARLSRMHRVVTTIHKQNA